MKKIYLCLGRFGDLHMVCKAIKEPAIIACSSEFSQIVKELFQQHQVEEIKDCAKNNLEDAINIMRFKHPEKELIVCQQDGQDISLMQPFRTYQDFQEFHAASSKEMGFTPIEIMEAYKQTGDYFLKNDKKRQSSYTKVIINLDGTSSEVINKAKIKDNIIYVMKLLQIPYEFYENKMNGFQRLWFDMNQPNTLYILNDSLMYHFCEQKCILISRAIPWVMSNPKPNVIGQLTQEMIATDVTLLMAIIHRNLPMRQHTGNQAAHTYLMANNHIPQRLSRIAMYGAAAWSWHELSRYDIHFRPVFHTSDEPGLPKVNQILGEGLELLKHPDDILIVTNRDICLVKEAVGIIRCFMDSMDIDCCFSHRVDLKFDGLMHYDTISQYPASTGIDLFAFRRDAKCIDELLNIDLFLGRVGWDSLWADKIKNKLPYNICYHYPHDSDWFTKGEAATENIANIIQVRTHTNLRVNAQPTVSFEVAK